MRVDYAQQVKDAVTMPDVCHQYGIDVNRGGFTPCVFHQEKTGSMKIYPGGYHCYGCGAHGDVIDFTAQLFGLKFQDAVKKLNDDFRIGLPIGQRLSSAQLRAAEQQAEHQRREREKQKHRLVQLEAQYDVALAAYALIDRIILAGQKNAAYYDAVRKKEWAEYQLDTAEIMLNAERRRKKWMNTYNCWQ